MTDDKDFKAYIETLPPEIKAAIYSIDYPQKLQEIVRNNKLMIDQAGKLEAETTLVMAGIEPMDNYLKNLMSNVGLTSIQASVVAHDVNELIFKGIRDALKKINDQILKEEKLLSEKPEVPTKEEVLAGIESPEEIKNTEPSVSLSSMTSTKPEMHPEMQKEGIEIRVSHLPEVAPETKLAVVPGLSSKPAEPLHINIPPVQNIVGTKLTETVAVPKEQITIEDKTKLPEKQKPSTDPYREMPI